MGQFLSSVLSCLRNLTNTSGHTAPVTCTGSQTKRHTNVEKRFVEKRGSGQGWKGDKRRSGMRVIRIDFINV